MLESVRREATTRRRFWLPARGSTRAGEPPRRRHHEADLALVGAPGQVAYLAPAVLVPLARTPGFLGNFATVPLPIPANPSLTGTVLYAQAIAVDPAANPFGGILTDAVEVRLGGANDTLPVRQVDSLDPIASSGTLLDFGFGAGTPRFGCVAFQLVGAFQ